MFEETHPKNALIGYIQSWIGRCFLALHAHVSASGFLAMPHPYRIGFVVAVSWFCTQGLSLGFQVGLESLVQQARGQLQPIPPDKIEQKRVQTRSLCQSTIDRLSRTAIGYALSLDMKLPELLHALDSPTPDRRFLADYEPILRRIVPGPDQVLVEELRKQVEEFRRMLASTEPLLIEARESLDRFTALAKQNQSLVGSTDREELCKSFENLHTTNLSPRMLEEIQTTVSHPNVLFRLRKQIAERESHVPFHIPVDADTCRDQTRVTADGSLLFEVHACFPENADVIPLLVNISGSGDIRAIVSRSKASISANIHVEGSGSQPLELTQRGVNRKEPQVHARLDSRLQAVRLDGLLNKSHILRRLLSRIAQTKLVEQDATLSSQIETKATEKASEEGLKLANKVNAILNNNVWSRLESLDFAPHVWLSSDPIYLQSRSLYALPEQLGSLTRPPSLQPDLERKLDWIAMVHESAISNILESLRGKTLDEATIRGVWQVQLKLTDEPWELPTVAHIPSSVTLDSTTASAFHFGDHTAEFVLRFADGKLDDGSPIGAPCTATVRYRLNASSTGIEIVRDEIELAGNLTSSQRQAWTGLLARFLPESVSPIPRFRPSLWQQYVSLEHLQAREGWLTAGLAFHTEPRSKPIELPSKGGSR